MCVSQSDREEGRRRHGTQAQHQQSKRARTHFSQAAAGVERRERGAGQGPELTSA